MKTFTLAVAVLATTVSTGFLGSSHAANLTTMNNVGGNTGWNTAGIWRTNGLNPGVSPPVPGNTYACVSNGVAFGNSTGNTRMRNLYQGTDTNFQTFPGDSLTLYTNTEFRFKRIAENNVPVCNFPGVNGNPGLILDGGVLNAGDDGVFPIAGKVHIASESYIVPGDNGGGATLRPNRGFNISAQLSGSAPLVLFQGTTNTPQTISGTNNTFSGQWIVKAGRLLGTMPNSLGTNSITLDPLYVLPTYFSETAPIAEISGPAVLEVNYNLNSAGTLTLANGGRMRLHQNCAFSAVIIEGTPLSPGVHFYTELIANFPNNFDPGGSGALIVQPYGTLPSLGPTILTQPGDQILYAGHTAHFTVAASANGAPPLTYRWRKSGGNLNDGGNLSGVTNATLTVTGVSGTDLGIYDVVVFNAGGSVTSTPVTLTIVAPSGEAYEAAVIAANPVAFYQLNETGDPTTNNSPFYDYAGGFNGTFGLATQNGNPTYNIAGPVAGVGFPGFLAGNKAAQQANGDPNTRMTTQPWNLNTNTVTLTAWVNPNGPQIANTGIIFNRGGGTVVGLNYANYTDVNGNSTLAYHWNDEFETRAWNSGLATPPGQWSFVALVITPTTATIHVMNTNGLLSVSQAQTHIVQAFGGTTVIGDDTAGANGARVFNGNIDDVAVFNRALTKTELLNLFSAASGITTYAPLITTQPASVTRYVGQTAQFRVVGGGSEPLTYQWRAGVVGSGNYTNLVDGGRISGSGTASLNVANVNDAYALDYLVVLANSAASGTSQVATLTVSPTSAPEDITLTIQQPALDNWETPSAWSDGLAASESAAAKPGSTYRLLAGARMRSPEGPTSTNFPGDVLILEGDGIWNVNPAAGATISEIRFKQPTYGIVNGRVNFKRLVLNGGQLDSGNAGILLLGGRIDVLTNAPINNDSGDDRGYLIDAWLTGGGTIEVHGYNQTAFQPTYTRALNIAGTSNTFSGRWNVVTGVLLGSAPGGLGTNNIIVGPNGALETLYDINNTNASLLLSGKLFLHRDHAFRTVIVAGNSLNPGTYTHAQLAATYPANFPSTWTMQAGSTVSNASGTLTVLAPAAPSIVVQPPAAQSFYPSQTAQFSVLAVGQEPLFYQWRKNGANLGNGTTPGNSVITGANATNLAIANLASSDGGDYTVVITNAVGAVTSSIAALTINPVGPAENITMSIVQPAGSDWNTGADWSDGLPAATSALSKPGSTYQILPGARLRTPVSGAAVEFPGNVLTLDGDGVWTENGANISELRFKQTAGGSVHFKRLVMNGGQLDSGDNSMSIIAGRMDVVANAPIYADSAAGQSRAWRIDAWLTGNGSIELHDFNTSFTGNLNITGTSNTFSGTWNIVRGALLGSGANSLGTNSITVATEGALEVTYNLNNPAATLTLDGLMFLHQNVTFRNVIVAGVPLNGGTYSFTQLNAAYPANFPATWTQLTGSSVSSGSGSLTVIGSGIPPVNVSISTSGNQLQLNWSQGVLLEATNVTGPWTTNAAATSPFNVVPSGPRKFYRIQVQ